MSDVAVVVDGTPLVLRSQPGTHLQRALFDAGVSSVKAGCEEGECGSCSVLLDDVLVCACLVPAATCNDATVSTAASLATPEIVEAVARLGGVQCGFCTPGFVVAISAILAAERQFTREEICEALAGNLCRCTGYQALVDAVCELMERGA